jgi:hypothetical protein
MMDRARWGKLGQMMWNVNVSEYIVDVLRGLKIPANVREPYQCSCKFMNNIKQYGFATDPAVLEDLLYCKWDTGLLQLQSFESVKGAAGAKNKSGDPTGRHLGLVMTVRNLMWFMAALVHEVYFDILEQLAINIQDSEHLFRVSGALLVHLINEDIGAVFRSIPVKSSVVIADVSFPLSGPSQVAAALRAAGARLIAKFSSRQALRDLQITFDEESSDRSDVATLIASVYKGNNKRKEVEATEEVEVKLSQRQKKSLARERSAAGGVDLGQSVQFLDAKRGHGSPRGGQKQNINMGGAAQNSQPINLGGAPQSGRRQSLGICNKHMAGLLMVKTAGGQIEKCDKSKGECRFSHHDLCDTRFDDAARCVLSMNNEDLRKRINAKLIASKPLFKQ